MDSGTAQWRELDVLVFQDREETHLYFTCSQMIFWKQIIEADISRENIPTNRIVGRGSDQEIPSRSRQTGIHKRARRCTRTRTDTVRVLD